MLLATASLVSTAALAQFVAGPTYDLSWNTIDGGGGTSAAGGFTLTGSIGQPDAGGPLIGGGFTLAGGFWSNGGTPAPLCPPDVAPIGSPDGVVNVSDLLAIIGGWGACANPNNCPTDIAPPGGDDLVNVQDLLAVIGAWGNCP